MTAVSKLAGAEWKALSEAKKKPYEENSQAVLIDSVIGLPNRISHMKGWVTL